MDFHFCHITFCHNGAIANANNNNSNCETQYCAALDQIDGVKCFENAFPLAACTECEVYVSCSHLLASELYGFDIYELVPSQVSVTKSSCCNILCFLWKQSYLRLLWDCKNVRFIIIIVFFFLLFLNLCFLFWNDRENIGPFFKMASVFCQYEMLKCY